MTRGNADFRNYASRKFLRAGLERASMFDSAGQISHSALVAWNANDTCGLAWNTQSKRILLVGQITCTHPTA
jgi:hypothetical protein